MMDEAAKILVVDDDDDIREAISAVLETSGYEPIEASSGADALEQLHRHRRPSMILLDLMMPGISGADFMRALRADPALADIPVVILSGDTSVRETAVALGASASLPKPVDLDNLVSTVSRVSARA